MDGQAGARVTVEINFQNGGVFGREEVLLIDAIRTQRSIIGASRALGLSYRKCWLVVDALNRTFESAVIATYPAGAAAAPKLPLSASGSSRSISRSSVTPGPRRKNRSWKLRRLSTGISIQRPGAWSRGAIWPDIVAGNRHGLDHRPALSPGTKASRATDSRVISACSRVLPRLNVART